MKNTKWESLDLQDVRKGMQVACCADGMSPKGHVLNKIKDVIFDVFNGEISIQLENCRTIPINLLISRQRQLYQVIPLTVEEKYERLMEAVGKCTKDIRFDYGCDCFLALAKLAKEFKES